jgi:Carboxypeptidase regulatory-like domain
VARICLASANDGTQATKLVADTGAERGLQFIMWGCEVKNCWVVLCLGALLCVVPAFGQGPGSAVLNGDITDPSGAAVAGAEVVAQNKATSLSRTATSNDAGLCIINGLAPGQYEVRITAGGFSPTVTQVQLEVGQQQDLKIRLSLESAQTTVNIAATDAGPLVNTTTSIVDGVIGSQQIDALPLNGRNFLELALLVPGNTPAPNFDPTKSDPVVISTDGQLGRAGNVTIDGADNNDDTVGGMLHNVPEVFNLFNTTNILGVSNTNYWGFANVLVHDSNTPGDPGYLHSSSFGAPVTTAGGVFGSGGPRAFQLALRFSF